MSRSSSLSDLARLGFEDLSSASERIQRLQRELGETLGLQVLERISLAASPDEALRSLLELSEKSSGLLSAVLQSTDASERLIRVLGASDALADHLIRHPEQLEVFLSESATPERIQSLPQADGARDLLRVSYRRELLRIADFDLSQPSATGAVRDVARRLAQLADDALEAALEIAKWQLQLSGEFAANELAESKLAVIAMGKCGARELNYLSDIDVIFVGAEANPSLPITTRLASLLMRVLDEPALEPPLWTVDANLRPEGKSGALVRSLASHEAYFDKWAENWEYQAQLKARFAAGDRDLGAAYEARVSKRVWEKQSRGNLVETVRKMRARVIENIPETVRNRELKLGLGGLRDVEFTIQLLQLVHGVADREVRVADTLGAIEALSKAGFIGRASAAELANNYSILRVIEHRIQLHSLERDHIFPDKESRQRRIARSIPEFGTTELLLTGWQHTKQRVIQLTQDIFYRPLLNAMANLSAEDVNLSDVQVESRLRAIGFVDARGAIRHIAALTQGVSRSAQMQRNLLPVLLRWIGEGAFPDRGLLAFRRLSEALGESHWFLRMLRDESGAAQRMSRVIAAGAFTSDLLEQIPESAAWFGNEEQIEARSRSEVMAELDALIERHTGVAEAVEAVQWVRRREVLRAAIRATLDGVSLDSQMPALTDLTDCYLAANLKIAERSIATPADMEVAVIGMGRLGGAELTLASDADVILVYRSKGDSAASVADQIAGELVANCQDLRLLFELDLELRPEGKKGPRIRSLESYQNYYERWAEEWEYQALLKARFVAGSAALGAAFIDLIASYRYPAKFDSAQAKKIRVIKARVEAERLPKGADPTRHLKLGRGGISDVEWLVQLEQLRLAAPNPELRTQGTLPTLEALGRLGQLEPKVVDALVASWRLASRLRIAIALVTGKPGDQLPTDRLQLAGVSNLLQSEGPAALENEYLGASRRARRIFEEKFFGASGD